jgi:Co/Zn/Cd efflux system component
MPDAGIMGGVGVLALTANVGSALLLYWHRGDDLNMRSVWLCSRNDAIANVLVLMAAGAVALTATAWPDLIVGAAIAALELSAAYAIICAAVPALRSARAMGD